MQRTYSKQNVIQIIRRYTAGDLVAGEEVDALVRGRQSETGETYRAALRYIVHTGEPQPNNQKLPRDDFATAGNEIEKWVVKLIRDLSVDRRTAIRLACSLCPDHYGPTYVGRPVERMSVEEVYRIYSRRAS